MLTFRKVFNFFLFFISLILLIYTFYQSEIVWFGSKRNFYYVFYFLSLSILIFSIIFNFIKENIKDYIIIIFISFFVSVYSFEIFITFKNPVDTHEKKINTKYASKYKERTGKDWDFRSKNEIYNDLKKNENLAIIVHPASYIRDNHSIFPLSGISNIKTIFCNENGYYAQYLSDRYGFNNPDEEWNKEKIEYLMVGDSFTHGACVNRPFDIASVLRKLSSKSVLNLGYVGNGPLVQLATLKEYLDSRVNIILWMYFEGNDLSDLSWEMSSNLLLNYYNNENFTQKLKEKQNLINEVADKKIMRGYTEKIKTEKNFEYIKFIKLINTRNILHKLLPKKFQPDQQSLPINEFIKILQIVKNKTEQNNSKLFFVYLPENRRYMGNYQYDNYDLIKKKVNEINIPFIDIHEEVLLKEPNPLKLFSFEEGNHYTIDGYYKVAKTIYNITKNNY
jgi:hypothetical protein